MKRRDFLQKTMVSAVAIGALGYGCNSSKIEGNTDPRMWVWTGGPSLQPIENWREDLSKFRDSGITDILPNANYLATHDADHADYQKNLDQYLAVISLANEMGLKVHAWMWSMPCGDKKIIENHGDWYAVSREGKPAHTHPAYVAYYKFLCARKKPVREYVQQKVKRLSKIEPLDGIHLDYIRYPDAILAEALQPKYKIVQDQEYAPYDYCYCDTCVQAFKDKTGENIREMGDQAQFHQPWIDFRYSAVTDLVNEYLIPVAQQAKKEITAAVFPNWESVRQAWHQWDLDAFLPMLYHQFYNETPAWIADQVKAARGRLNNDKPIYAGLFVDALSPEDLTSVFDKSQQYKGSGFAFFERKALLKGEKLETTKTFINQR